MKSMKRISALLLAMVLCWLMPAAAFAGSGVQYEGGAEKFVFLDDDDLFDSFKNVMPGDVLTQKVQIENKAAGCDYVDIYLWAEAHGEGNTPVNPTHRDDFLAQLTMTVTQGEKTLFDDSPHKTGGLTDKVLLGSLRRGQACELTVELQVPLTLGNDFANSLGEVDWIFLAEERDDPSVPKTGDMTVFWPYVLAIALAAGALLILIVYKRNRKTSD